MTPLQNTLLKLAKNKEIFKCDSFDWGWNIDVFHSNGLLKKSTTFDNWHRQVPTKQNKKL